MRERSTKLNYYCHSSGPSKSKDLVNERTYWIVRTFCFPDEASGARTPLARVLELLIYWSASYRYDRRQWEVEA